jgi:hypothetical protein
MERGYAVIPQVAEGIFRVIKAVDERMSQKTAKEGHKRYR